MGTPAFLQGARASFVNARSGRLMPVVREVGEGQGTGGQAGTSNLTSVCLQPHRWSGNDHYEESGQPAQRHRDMMYGFDLIFIKEIPDISGSVFQPLCKLRDRQVCRVKSFYFI